MPERLGDGMYEVEVRHLLVANLRVEAHHVGVFEGVDERESVAHGRQQDVATRLVGLGLDREAQPVPAVDDVLGQRVEGLFETVERDPHVLGGLGLGALPAAPEHVGLGAEFGGEVEVAHDLAEGVSAH